MSLDAMKQALAALNDCTYDEEGYCLNPDNVDAILALRAAIEQSQEPVAWMNPSWIDPDTRGWASDSFESIEIEGWIPLYTAPRQWQGLTDEEIKIIWRDIDGSEGMLMRFARAIEAKLKAKNA